MIEHDTSIYNLTVNSDVNCRESFTEGKPLPKFDYNMPRPCSEDWPVTAVTIKLGEIKEEKSERRKIIIGYDQVDSIEYFGTIF